MDALQPAIPMWAQDLLGELEPATPAPTAPTEVQTAPLVTQPELPSSRAFNLDRGEEKIILSSITDLVARSMGRRHSGPSNDTGSESKAIAGSAMFTAAEVWDILPAGIRQKYTQAETERQSRLKQRDPSVPPAETSDQKHALILTRTSGAAPQSQRTAEVLKAAILALRLSTWGGIPTANISLLFWFGRKSHQEIPPFENILTMWSGYKKLYEWVESVRSYADPLLFVRGIDGLTCTPYTIRSLLRHTETRAPGLRVGIYQFNMSEGFPMLATQAGFDQILLGYFFTIRVDILARSCRQSLAETNVTDQISSLLITAWDRIHIDKISNGTDINRYRNMIVLN